MVKFLLLLALAAGIWIWWRRNRLRPTAMGTAEARALLGVGKDATLQDIRDAHRRLIGRVHPDTGGSAELAVKVNAARDALVAEHQKRTPRAS